MTYKEQVDSLLANALKFSEEIEECTTEVASLRKLLNSDVKDVKSYPMLDGDAVPDAIVRFFDTIGGVPRWWNKELTPIEEIDEECTNISADNAQVSINNMQDSYLDVKNSDIRIPMKESLSESDSMEVECDTHSKSRLSGYTLTYPSGYRIPKDHPISGWSNERKERYVRGVIANARQYSYNKFMKDPICAAYDCAECDCDIDLLLYNKSRWLYKTWFSLRGEREPEMQFYAYYGIYDYGR